MSLWTKEEWVECCFDYLTDITGVNDGWREDHAKVEAGLKRMTRDELAALERVLEVGEKQRKALMTMFKALEEAAKAVPADVKP